MPLILMGRRAPGGEALTFPSRVTLRPRALTFTFRSSVLPPERAMVTFTSLVRLRTARVTQRFPSYAALRPAVMGGGAGGGSVTPDGPSLPPGTPVQIIPGAPPRRWQVSCPLGRAVSASYEHSGESETATLTFPGEVTPGASVQFGASLGDLPALARSLTVDPRQYEIRRSRTGPTTTTLRAYNPASEWAGSSPLPELVPWKLAPRAEDSTAPGRTLGVSDLVRRAFAAAGVGFGLVGDDPFAGETWQEGARDVSTEGRTAADVFGDSYGALGYRLIVRGSALYGLAPGASLTGAGDAFTRCEIEGLTERGEAAQVPGRIRLTAADLVVQGPEPEPEEEGEGEEQSEQDRLQSWNEKAFTGSGFTVSAGYVVGGRVRQEQQVEIGRVEVKETVQGEEGSEVKTRVFDRVLISDTKTTYAYHPDCPEALIRQQTTKRGYGYTLNTQPQMRSVSGQMFSASLPGGDLVENQTEIIAQQWYDSGDLAGYLKSRRTEGKRLVSVEQEGAEAEPEERGPLQGREYVAQVQGEIYRRVGKLWHRHYATTGGATVPLYDLDSGEAVRLAVRTGAMTSGSEVMRNEPPRVDWPKAATQDPENPESPEPRPEISLPQRAAFAVAGGGVSTLEQAFPMLRTADKLPQFAAILAYSRGPRVVQEAQLSVPRGLLPGSEISSPVSGIVESLSISTEGGKGTARITAARTTAPALTPIPWPDDRPQQGFVTRVENGVVHVTVPRVSAGGVASGASSGRLLPGFAEPTVGSVVGIGTDSQGRRVIRGD